MQMVACYAHLNMHWRGALLPSRIVCAYVCLLSSLNLEKFRLQLCNLVGIIHTAGQPSVKHSPFIHELRRMLQTSEWGINCRVLHRSNMKENDPFRLIAMVGSTSYKSDISHIYYVMITEETGWWRGGMRRWRREEDIYWQFAADPLWHVPALAYLYEMHNCARTAQLQRQQG